MMEKLSLTDLRRQFFGPTLDESVLYGVDAVVEHIGVSNRDGGSGREDQQTKNGREYSNGLDDLRQDVTSADTLDSVGSREKRSDLNQNQSKDQMDSESRKQNSTILEDNHRKPSISSSGSKGSKNSTQRKSMDSDLKTRASSDVSTKSSEQTENQMLPKEEKRVSIESSASSTKSKDNKLTEASISEYASTKSNRNNRSEESVKSRRMSSLSSRMNIVDEVVESFGETEKFVPCNENLENRS
ncbi:uncharacterized protein LOC110675670 [Aedes aegypti]|uniref:Uncharacterized protein n=1 Tax=Aedes aegypti TaxID=7159 RepID=A0A6I8U1Z2_AEDAE|nr:uncharacterized protein LOC110675670 [Aedes aegypti]